MLFILCGKILSLLSRSSIPGQETDPDTEGLTLSVAPKHRYNRRDVSRRASSIKTVPKSNMRIERSAVANMMQMKDDQLFYIVRLFRTLPAVL